MAFYRVCPECGCYLDPGEKCDCAIKSEQLKKKYEQLTSVTDNGQLEFGGIYGREDIQSLVPVHAGSEERS